MRCLDPQYARPFVRNGTRCPHAIWGEPAGRYTMLHGLGPCCERVSENASAVRQLLYSLDHFHPGRRKAHGKGNATRRHRLRQRQAQA